MMSSDQHRHPSEVKPRVADGALTGSPALKNLQGQGIVSDAMSALSVAMMGMMDELAKSDNTLANRADRIGWKPRCPNWSLQGRNNHSSHCLNLPGRPLKGRRV
jgi:hypothetical protein